MIIERGASTVLLTTVAIVTLALWQRRANRFNFIVGTMLIAIAYGIASLGTSFTEGGSVTVATACAVLAVSLGVVGVVVAIWGILRDLPQPLTASSSTAASEARAVLKMWISRLIVPGLAAVLGSSALILDDIPARIITGFAIFAIMLLLTYIAPKRNS